MTRVGQLAALDQQVRQLESFGAVDHRRHVCSSCARIVPYRPVLQRGYRFVARLADAVVDGGPRRPAGAREPDAATVDATFAQVLTVIVHASAIFAVRALIAAPINYARESLGGATSLSMRDAGVRRVDVSSAPAGRRSIIFVVWWVVLIALGLSILYQTRTLPIARWLFGAYAGGAAALALTQALRGGV